MSLDIWQQLETKNQEAATELTRIGGRAGNFNFDTWIKQHSDIAAEIATKVRAFQQAMQGQCLEGCRYEPYRPYISGKDAFVTAEALEAEVRDLYKKPCLVQFLREDVSGSSAGKTLAPSAPPPEERYPPQPVNNPPKGREAITSEGKKAIIDRAFEELDGEYKYRKREKESKVLHDRGLVHV